MVKRSSFERVARDACDTPASAVEPSPALTLYDGAVRALAEVKQVDEVKSIRDKTLAVQEYGRRANDKRLVGDAKEIQLYAERRLGELLAEMPKATGSRGMGRPKIGGSDRELPKDAPTLAELGIDKKLSVRARKFAKKPLTEFRGFVEMQVEKAAGLALPHRTSFSGDEQWFTPPEWLERARSVLGEFDLDPASHPAAQEQVQAKRFFTAEENGLAQDWHGVVWLNPPYTQPFIERFVDKLIAEVAAGRTTAAILLTHNSTDTVWGQKALTACDAVCFPAGRIRFVSLYREAASPTQGQMLCYFGRDVSAFVRQFNKVGTAGALK
jgi:ParB family chromosome partitioning protein